MLRPIRVLKPSRKIQRRFRSDVVILNAVRTPIGSAWGSLASVKASALASVTIKANLEATGIPAAEINEVLLGNVVQAAQGQAPARQAVIGAGMPTSVDCTTVNKVCSSGMKTITMAAQTIISGTNQVVIAGGFESMSNVPYYLDQNARTGLKYGHGKILDGIVHDGLWDVYNNFHMGNCGENTAKVQGIGREEQDAYAINSYKRAEQAWAAGYFKNEIVPVTVQLGKGKTAVIAEDEEYKKVDFTKVPNLKPAFVSDGTGTITAANASTLNDGASTLVISSQQFADKKGIKPLARIIGFADAAGAPIDFPVIPALAIPVALERAGLKASDIDLWEINEAFSVVVLANIKILQLDPSKVNVNGGAVSLGHPIGCSGARIVTSLAHSLQRTGARYGCAAICNGGGGATAIVIERV